MIELQHDGVLLPAVGARVRAQVLQCPRVLRLTLSGVSPSSPQHEMLAPTSVVGSSVGPSTCATRVLHLLPSALSEVVFREW